MNKLNRIISILSGWDVDKKENIIMEYRNKQLNFRVTDSEYEIIQKKMKLSGIKKPTAYLRKMAIDGYVIRLDLSELTEILRLARINSNNLNQVAKRANETGNIYPELFMSI